MAAIDVAIHALFQLSLHGFEDEPDDRSQSALMGIARYAASILLACVPCAHAADDADAATRALAAGCLACHQPAEKSLPTLHGQLRASLASKFRAYRDATLPGTVMPQLAKGYTDAEIDAIAGYFASAQASP